MGNDNAARRTDNELTQPEPAPASPHELRPTPTTFRTCDQVAEDTQFSHVTIRRLCARGEIPAKKLAGQWRISEEAYAEWVAGGEPEPGVVRPRQRRRMAEPASRWQLRAIEGGDA
jgi:excisionase family DNA binding protein